MSAPAEIWAKPDGSHGDNTGFWQSADYRDDGTIRYLRTNLVCRGCELREKMNKGNRPECPHAYFYDSSYHAEWHFVFPAAPACMFFSPVEENEP